MEMDNKHIHAQQCFETITGPCYVVVSDGVNTLTKW